MNRNLFLWPEGRFIRAVSQSFKLVSCSKIEQLLGEMFPSGTPVLCSSGRAALALSISGVRVGRADLVGVFPFASHCVLDAVARTATPLSGSDAIKAKYRVVYHQWGFVQEKALHGGAIEDCADTLCIPGADLFPGGGDFEIWSLAKILGTTSGGVLWCRDKSTAENLRAIRDQRGGGFGAWLLKMAGAKFRNFHYLWQGLEPQLGTMSWLQRAEIAAMIEKWADLVRDRQRKLSIIWPLAIDGLEMPEERLPTVVPCSPSLCVEKIHGFNLSSGIRTFCRFRNGAYHLEKVFPVPVHQEVPVQLLDEIAGLAKRGESKGETA